LLCVGHIVFALIIVVFVKEVAMVGLL